MLEDWTAEACAALGLQPEMIDGALVLDLARDVAHGVARPAAPLTAYLVGIAVGRGAAPGTATATVRALLARRAPAAAEPGTDPLDRRG